jgi:hypothetical protein
MESIVRAALENEDTMHNPDEQTKFINDHKLEEGVYWDWGSRGTRSEFRRMIRDSGHYDDYAKLVGGVIIVNHLISFFNALRIANTQSAPNVQIYTNVERDMTRWLNLQVSF